MENMNKFRGKSPYGAKGWLYGFYVKKDGKPYIYDDDAKYPIKENFREIIPETVSRYIGKRTELFNDEIYENDRVMCHGNGEYLSGIVKFGKLNMVYGFYVEMENGEKWSIDLIEEVEGDIFENM